ncbi:MAG: glycogen synthase GlgA [Zetaproteobacteria bacterium]|nr:glycogen synthase GlgA [Zetaproteobacteria bacterium]
MSSLTIVFASSEATPIAKTGGLADIAGALPQALRKMGHELFIFMPFYKHHVEKSEIVTTQLQLKVEIFMDHQVFECPIHLAIIENVHYYLVEYNPYFDRDGLYGPPGGAYDDNISRFTLFNRATLETLRQLRIPVDIIHCHDWQTAMIPMMIDYQYQHVPTLAHAKTVYTIHNLAYQGVFGKEWITRLGLPEAPFHLEGYEFHHQINCMKAGIYSADAITTVSQTYAQEILTAEYGCELDGFLIEHRDKLLGIVNGLMIEEWNPETDTVIEAPYSAENLLGKSQCKRALQTLCGWKPNSDVPILTAITRLADQKGVDLILAAAIPLLERGCQMVIVGSGDPYLEHALHQLCHSHASQVYFYQGFNEDFARMAYAGGDIFLMPSRFEPCGLGQLMAMRYGTIPVARATGGLKDTIINHQFNPEQSTGFLFDHANVDDFLHSAHIAVTTWYAEKELWHRMTQRAMLRDSSWSASAQLYKQLYLDLVRHD